MTRLPRSASAPFALCVVLAAGVAVLVMRVPSGVLRGLLMDWQFWTLELQFALLAALTALNWSRLRAALDMSRRAYLTAAAASVLAVVLASSAAPRTNRIYYDEQIYQNAAHLLADGHRAAMCNEGDVEFGWLRCARAEYNKQPYGYPYLLSIGYRLFGAQEWVAFRFNNLVAGALVWVAFGLAALLFRDPRAAGLSALMMALIPHLLRWTNTAASEPTAALMCGVAVLAAALFVRSGATLSLAWTVAACAFAATTRPESPMVIAVVAMAMLAFRREEFLRPRLWWAACVGVLLLVPTLAHTASVRSERWGAPDERVSLSFAVQNLQVNGPFYLLNEHFPALFTLLAAVGVFARRHARAVLVLGTFFVLFWGVFLFFYAGSYAYGADVRYSILSYLPLITLAGAGGAAVVDRLTLQGRALGRHAMAGVMTIILFHALLFLPLVRSVGEESWAARADVAIAREFSRQIPVDGIVLTHNPGMFLLWGTNAAQTGIAVSEESYVRGFLAERFPGGVFFHWNFWCNVDDRQQVALCDEIKQRYPFELVATQRRRHQVFELYRLRLDPPNDARHSR